MRKLSYADVTASLALFVALGGGSFAALDKRDSPLRVRTVQATGEGVSRSTTCPQPPAPCPTPTPEAPAVRLTVDVPHRANLLLLATGTYTNTSGATLGGTMVFSNQPRGSSTKVPPGESATVSVQHLMRKVKPGKHTVTLQSHAGGGTFGDPLDYAASVVVLTLPPS